MGIDAVLRSENGEDLTCVGDERMILARAATSGQFSGLRLLKYLVPWGDAAFNQAQADDLQDDVRLYSEAHAGSPISRHLREIQPLVERLSSETHQYLWFIGD